LAEKLKLTAQVLAFFVGVRERCGLASEFRRELWKLLNRGTARNRSGGPDQLIGVSARRISFTASSPSFRVYEAPKAPAIETQAADEQCPTFASEKHCGVVLNGGLA
jgi:hypothetical protein